MREGERIEVLGQPPAVFRRIHRFEEGRKWASPCRLCTVSSWEHALSRESFGTAASGRPKVRYLKRRCLPGHTFARNMTGCG